MHTYSNTAAVVPAASKPPFTLYLLGCAFSWDWWSFLGFHFMGGLAVGGADRYIQEKTSDRLFSKGGDAVVTRVLSWKMKSIYPEGKPEGKPEEKNQAMKPLL